MPAASPNRTLLLSRHYHERIFATYGLTISLLYLLRFVSSLFDGLIVEPLLFFGIMVFFSVLTTASFCRARFELSNFILNTFILFSEIFLLYRGYSDFPRLYIIAPVTLVYTCLISGMWYGLAFSTMLVGSSFWVFQFPETQNFFDRLPLMFDRYRTEFLILLVLSQIFVAGIGYLFAEFIGKSESEDRGMKVEKAKLEHNIHMAMQIGQIAHEVNNPLAILDGGLQMLSIYQKNGDVAGQMRCLQQIRESSVRLHSLVEIANEKSDI